MSREDAKISCPTFQKQEMVINGVTDKINKARGIQEKVVYAEELQRKVEVLLSCADYDKRKIDCKNCHLVSNIRRKTADLIIKTKKLA